MATVIHLDYCGMAGSGPTVREAKADAARKIESLLSDVGKGPMTLVVKDKIALVWRDTHGFAYSILNGGGEGVKSGRVYGCSSIGTEGEAIRYAVSHAADCAWSFEVADDEAFARQCVWGLVKDEDRLAADLASRWNWQRRYRVVRDAGHPDVVCHDLACRTRDLEHVRAEVDARRMQMLRGQDYEVSSCGQTVRLGSAS